MTTALNSYATKVFSEHPNSLWALDEDIGYIRYINNTNQDLNNWTATGATVVASDSAIAPFPTVKLNTVTASATSTSFFSSLSFGESDFDLSLKSVSIGAFFLTGSSGLLGEGNTIGITLGYRYQHPSDSLGVYRESSSNSISVPSSETWGFVSETVELPENFSDLDFFIKTNNHSSSYEVSINGINIGQWAEEFQVSSLGVIPSALPTNINLTSSKIDASPYGLDGLNGYYLCSPTNLYANNSGLPLVYGSFNSTAISPNPTLEPSLIIPGFGFMNSTGQYQNLTCEFWIKARVHSFSHKRIFGPISSTDGLYVEGPFLKLMIGSNIGSHFVGEWERPMLINIRLSPTQASLVINGEEVISLGLVTEDITYPEKYDVSNNDQDWLGFYSYEDVPLIQIDCVGIYPYEVPTIVSKRRWVYGQGVEASNRLVGASSSNTLTFDNSFAKYAKTYTYPKLGRWANGFIDNLVPSSEQLELPSYSLPEISFNNKTNLEWYTDLEASQDLSVFSSNHFIDLKPNSSWNGTEGYLKFSSLNLLLEETKALFGTFLVRSLPTTQEILMDLVNETTGSRLTVYMENDIVSYVFKYKKPDGTYQETTLFSASDHFNDIAFHVGFHIQRIVDYYGGAVATFFGSKQNIKVFIGGNPNFEKTFSGKIFNVSFSTAKNLSKISSEFLIKGFPNNFSESYEEVIVIYDGDTPDETLWDQDLDANGPVLDLTPGAVDQAADIIDGSSPNPLMLVSSLSHIGSYTLKARTELDNFMLDIAVDGYWEDYLPLSYFAKYVDGAGGNKYLDVDFLQFSIDYPHLDIFSNGNYDYSGSHFRTYATFQYISEGANNGIDEYTEISLPVAGVVRPTSAWQTEKYEIIDDTILYPPDGVDFSLLSVNIHMEFQIPGLRNNSFKVRSLRLASRALSQGKNNIGNKFGVEIYPYKKGKNYTDYKFVEPFSLYKNSVPYFYSAGNTGLRFRKKFSIAENAGFEIPINKKRSNFFKLGAFQIQAHVHDEDFSNAPTLLFEIESLDKTLKFYLRQYTNNSKRGYIYAIDSTTNSLASGITYALNGNITNKPTINPEDWFVLGISLDTALSFNDYTGYLRITSPILFNNLSAHQISEQDELARSAVRKWYSVNTLEGVQQDWDDWKDDNMFDGIDEYIWSQVLYISQVNPTAPDIEKSYRQFTGTDKIVIETDKTLTFQDYRYAVLQNIKWSTQTIVSA